MKKLILQINTSIDGFVGDSDGKLDWMTPESDPNQIEFLNDLTNRVGAIVLGRKMAIESIPHWEQMAQNKTENQEVQFAKFFVKTPKTVFSKTVKTIEGKNNVVENGNLKEKIISLKAKSKKDIIVYGGAGFVLSLIEEKLIDELNLFVHPVALGNGLSIFRDKFKFELLRSVKYENGIVLHQYSI
jgi:dihydrofolate reductase